MKKSLLIWANLVASFIWYGFRDDDFMILFYVIHNFLTLNNTFIFQSAPYL